MSEFVETFHGNMVRCKCGELVSVGLPCVCPRCKDPKTYWTTIDGTTMKLEQMGLEHLSNCVRLLARKSEQYPSGEYRTKLEIAMDLIYAEIGSRDAEISQAAGLMAALNRSLVGKEPCDA